MSFPSAIAGPSRLPFQGVATSYRCLATTVARSYSTAPADTVNPSTTPSTTPAPVVDQGPIYFGTAGKGKGRVRALPYYLWKRTVGASLETPTPGQKAKWLGGDVPYPMNPSFRPPPPIGNDLQDVLYTEMRRGTKTLGEIATEHNVSKARLSAIKKLKEVEEELKRQSVPLQTAFQQNMEPLLGVQSLVESRWSRNERGVARDTSDSTTAEIEEEKRWDAGIGQGGAFGNRNVEDKSWERTVFEWRGEDEHLDAKAAGIEEDVFPTPASQAMALKKAKSRKEARQPSTEKIVATNKSTTTWRFVDVSSSGVPQEHQVLKDMEKRSKISSKRKQQQSRRRGLF